jgi:opacity protein-like surface antigen
MRKVILAATSALALASPAVAADLSVVPRYSEVPGYEQEVQPYAYRGAPPVVVEEPAPLIVRRPLIVAPPPVVVEEYPIYAAPPVYSRPVYAYAGPGWRHGWGHRVHGRWYR